MIWLWWQVLHTHSVRTQGYAINGFALIYNTHAITCCLHQMFNTYWSDYLHEIIHLTTTPKKRDLGAARFSWSSGFGVMQWKDQMGVGHEPQGDLSLHLAQSPNNKLASWARAKGFQSALLVNSTEALSVTPVSTTQQGCSHHHSSSFRSSTDWVFLSDRVCSRKASGPLETESGS